MKTNYLPINFDSLYACVIQSRYWMNAVRRTLLTQITKLNIRYSLAQRCKNS